MVALELLAAVALIVLGAIGFTNAVEWLGHRLDLGAGAVGALLAAVGTALPESVIPIVALVGGERTAGETEIAIGAIIGAPFMLGTIAMLLVTTSAFAYRGRRQEGASVRTEAGSTRRDLGFFLAVFPVAIALGAVSAPAGVRYLGAALLLLAYGAYAWRTVRRSGEAASEEELRGLFFDPTKHDPPSTLQIIVQLIVALAAIIVGAELFVGAVEQIAASAGVSPLVLALVLAPLATELPEKANSVLWMRAGKDTLAVGNISGAMAFQATLPVALGLALTEWQLDRFALVAAAVGWVGAAIAVWALPRRRSFLVPSVAWAALFVGFVAFAAIG